MNKPRVYFAVLADLSYVKIGYSTCIHARMSSIRTGNPQKIHFSSIAFETLQEAQKAERAFHIKFKHLREKNEWFKFTNEIAREIRQAKFEYHRELRLDAALRRQLKAKELLDNLEKAESVRVKKAIEVMVEKKKVEHIIHYANNGFKTYCGIKPGVDTGKWTMMFQDVTCEKCKQERDRIIKECKKTPVVQKSTWAYGIYQ